MKRIGRPLAEPFRAWVVLDNFEHLLAAAPLLGRLIAEAPDVRLLVTSQAPLRVADEEVVAIDPLRPSATTWRRWRPRPPPSCWVWSSLSSETSPNRR